jgi:hypothetical protein
MPKFLVQISRTYNESVLVEADNEDAIEDVVDIIEGRIDWPDYADPVSEYEITENCNGLPPEFQVKDGAVYKVQEVVNE